MIPGGRVAATSYEPDSGLVLGAKSIAEETQRVAEVLNPQPDIDEPRTDSLWGKDEEPTAKYLELNPDAIDAPRCEGCPHKVHETMCRWGPCFCTRKPEGWKRPKPVQPDIEALLKACNEKSSAKTIWNLQDFARAQQVRIEELEGTVETSHIDQVTKQATITSLTEQVAELRRAVDARQADLLKADRRNESLQSDLDAHHQPTLHHKVHGKKVCLTTGCSGMNN